MYTLGIDIGSTTSKCVVLKNGEHIIATSLQIGGLGMEGPEKALNEIWRKSGLHFGEISKTIVTGYGRKNYKKTDGEMSELTCHALGGKFIYPDLRTIIDIGGQDAKIISLDQKGNMLNFVMNDKCAAGTGRFLDVMSSILQIKVNELECLAMQSNNPASISSTCTVFAESEVISQMALGVKRCDLVAGICESVAVRVATLARRVGVVEPVCMSGGVAKNGAVRRGLERNLNVEIYCDPLAQYFGAIGAAVCAWKKMKN